MHSIPANNSFFFAIFSKLNLEMNTLEDAFINIGMDEEKYLNPGAEKVKFLNWDFEIPFY